MDDALPWQQARHTHVDEPTRTRAGVTARTGGPGGDEPVLIARINGPVRIEMAQEALRDAGIPAYIKRDTMGMVYGLSVGPLAVGEVWVPRPLADQAEDVLAGIGVLED
jgi:hypothetical protein